MDSIRWALWGNEHLINNKVHDFNYRRYPVVMLCGGGIGVTPVMGILKDLYHVGEFAKQLGHVTPHVIEAVYVTCKNY